MTHSATPPQQQPCWAEVKWRRTRVSGTCPPFFLHRGSKQILISHDHDDVDPVAHGRCAHARSSHRRLVASQAGHRHVCAAPCPLRRGRFACQAVTLAVFHEADRPSTSCDSKVEAKSTRHFAHVAHLQVSCMVHVLCAPSSSQHRSCAQRHLNLACTCGCRSFACN